MNHYLKFVLDFLDQFLFLKKKKKKRKEIQFLIQKEKERFDEKK